MSFFVCVYVCVCVCVCVCVLRACDSNNVSSCTLLCVVNNVSCLKFPNMIYITTAILCYYS